MKKKKVKLVIFINFFVLLFSFYLFLSFKSYDYEKKYVVNKYKIIEKYNKNDSYYTFIIQDNEKIFSYMFINDYSRKRELITNIETFQNNSEICIVPESEILAFYPLCINGDVLYSYNISEMENIYKYQEINYEKNNYEGIEINTLNEMIYLLYNYKGFYLFNNQKRENIKLFDKDVYSLNLIYQKDNYLLVPDYNKNYYFNRFFVIDIKSGKVKNIDFEYDISFDSVFLGDFKNNIYLLDKKEEKEYKINIKKEKIELIKFQKLENDKMAECDFKDILDNDFIEDSIFKYEIIDNNLYQIIENQKIKLSNNKVDKIVKVDEESVYYLSGEHFYLYNNKIGEILLLSNFEWNFNNTNMIFLYK